MPDKLKKFELTRRHGHHNETRRMVILAADEMEARDMAYEDTIDDTGSSDWFDADYSTCREIIDATPRIIKKWRNP